jgi:squalene synthase HpnC
VTAPALPAAKAVRRRAGTENFSVASLLLGGATRRRLMAVYGFARLVDQLGDAVEDDRLAALDEAEAELDRAFAGDARTPIFRELEPVIRDCRLDREPFARLIEANRRDQAQAEYETWDDLVSYCELSANPVGRLVLAVFGAATPERVALSDDVCTALQVVEHLQDVAEDLARGRVYLPQEDLRQIGCSEVDLAKQPAPHQVRHLIAYESARARRLLEEGAPLARTLPWRARVAVTGFVSGGLAAIRAIERAGYDVSAGPPRASRKQRGSAFLSTGIRVARG